MSFVYHENRISIDGFEIPYEQFVRLEPSFVDVASQYETIVYRQDINHFQVTVKNTKETRKFLDCDWELGNHYISKLEHYKSFYAKFKEEEAENAKQLKQELLKTLPYDVARKEEYPSIDELVVALFEYIVEGKEDGLTKLEDKRTAIKQKYPKP